MQWRRDGFLTKHTSSQRNRFIRIAIPAVAQRNGIDHHAIPPCTLLRRETGQGVDERSFSVTNIQIALAEGVASDVDGNSLEERKIGSFTIFVLRHRAILVELLENVGLYVIAKHTAKQWLSCDYIVFDTVSILPHRLIAHPVEANGSRFVANRHPQSHFAIFQYTILPILQLLQEELVMSLSFFISCHISTTLPILHFPRVPDDSTVEMLRNSILLVILHLVYRILFLVLLLIRHNLVCLGIPFN